MVWGATGKSQVILNPAIKAGLSYRPISYLATAVTWKIPSHTRRICIIHSKVKSNLWLSLSIYKCLCPIWVVPYLLSYQFLYYFWFYKLMGRMWDVNPIMDFSSFYSIWPIIVRNLVNYTKLNINIILMVILTFYVYGSFFMVRPQEGFSREYPYKVLIVTWGSSIWKVL